LPSFTNYQKFVVAILAFLQFTIILDFMILSPLGATLMPALRIDPSKFGFVVSAYAFSAGTSGLLAAGFADKFDRKTLLLFFYVGFIFGTFLCGLAPSYPFLLVARMVTGLFGGVMGSIVLAITTDLFSYEMRGRVMGVIQTAFAGSQVLGIPAGLFLSNHWGWHMPFFMIAGIGGIVGIVIAIYLRPIDSHLKLHPDRSPFHHLVETVSTPRYLQAFATTALLSTGGFMLMPFASAFSVHNLGITLKQLPLVYLITGLCSIVIGPAVGRVSDLIGKYRMFCFGSAVSIVMVLIYTHLGITPLPWVIVVNTLMFVGIFSRMIPAQALMSAIPESTSRGSFMSINAAIQQVSGGVASVVAGLLVAESADGAILHFDRLGYAVITASLFSVTMMYFIHLRVRDLLLQRRRVGEIEALADGAPRITEPRLEEIPAPSQKSS
jgi:predicted MFS family arabinose efflux permease